MKKLLLLTLLSMTLFHCANDDQIDDNQVDDDMIVQEESSLFKLTVSNDYYSENELNTGAPKIFATDENGEIITEDVLDNGITVDLTTEFDVDNNKYDITFFKKKVSALDQRTNYSLKTFIDVRPYDLEMLNVEDQNPNDEKARVSIINSGGLLDEFHPIGMSLNNGIYNVNSTLAQIPDGFYLSFKKQTEDFKRYIWLDEVTGETHDTIDFADTEIIENPVSIFYPNNESVNSSVLGSLSTNSNRWYPLSYQYSNDGLTQLDHYIPNGLFDEYRLWNFIRINNDTYTTYEKSTELNTNYELPNLALEVLSSSHDDFQMTSASDYNYYSATFSYGLPNNEFTIDWRIYGKSSQTIEYALPDLFSEISNDFPSFDPSNMNLISVSLRKMEGINSFDQFICDVLNIHCTAEDLISSYEIYTKGI